MLIAISGSQGSGKSTVLTEVEKAGFKVIKRKTARSVLADFPNMSLDDIYADPQVAIKWQDAILKRKIEDELEYYESDDLCFTERSYADLFTYAVMAIGKNNRHSDWVDNYFDLCKRYNEMYTQCFYIHGGFFKPVSDGVRGTNQHYATMIDASLYSFLKRMTDAVHDIQTPTVKHRVDMVLTVSLNAFIEAR